MPCSYYTDPYLYNCKYDPIQDAIYIAESRAIAHAIAKGVVVVAAAGNENVDLQTVDSDDTSPDDVTTIGNQTVRCPSLPPAWAPTDGLGAVLAVTLQRVG